jgi:hypothetical protein
MELCVIHLNLAQMDTTILTMAQIPVSNVHRPIVPNVILMVIALAVMLLSSLMQVLRPMQWTLVFARPVITKFFPASALSVRQTVQHAQIQQVHVLPVAILLLVHLLMVPVYVLALPLLLRVESVMRWQHVGLENGTMERILVRTVLQIVPLVMTGQVFVVNAVLLIL